MSILKIHKIFFAALYTTRSSDEIHRGIFVRPLVSPNDLRPTTEIKEK